MLFCHYWLRYFVYKIKFALLPTMKAYRRIIILNPNMLNLRLDGSIFYQNKLDLLIGLNSQFEQHL